MPVSVTARQGLTQPLHRPSPCPCPTARTGHRRAPPSRRATRLKVECLNRRSLGLGLCTCCGGSSADDSKPSWSRFYGGLYRDALLDMYSSHGTVIDGPRRELFSQLTPSEGTRDLCEVGAGTGVNFQFFDEGLAVTTVEPSEVLRAEAERAGAGRFASLQQLAGRAEALPLGDASQDAVVFSLVLCSVGDVQAALQEAHRVLRPGGRLALVEHVLAEPGRALLRFAQRALTPLQAVLADGCHLDRDPLPLVRQLGFEVQREQRMSLEGLGLVAPQVTALAVKA